MKYIPNAIKFGNQSRSSSLIINMILEIADLDPKLKTWADLVLKLQCARLNMLIVNLLIGIDYFDPKL